VDRYASGKTCKDLHKKKPGDCPACFVDPAAFAMTLK
jgi:hypothetical protein